MSNIALLDLDGTCVDYSGQLKADLKLLASPNEPEFEIDWHDNDERPWLQNRIKLIKSQVGWWENLPKLASGFKLLEMVQSVGYDVHVLTKGPRTTQTAWTEKLVWCQKHLGDDIKVTITFDKSLVYGKVLIDDYPPYMDAWLKHRPRGLGIMPATDYNKGYKHPNVIKYYGPNITPDDEILYYLRKQYKEETENDF